MAREQPPVMQSTGRQEVARPSARMQAARPASTRMPSAAPKPRVGKLSDVGRARDHNEDWLEIFEPADPNQWAQKGALYIVADGMGGHQAGEVASQQATKRVIQDYYNIQANIPTALAQAIFNANAEIHSLQVRDPSKKGMGTTIVAAVIRNNEMYIAHVGDSRAYLVRGGKIQPLTVDHSWVEEQVAAGVLTREQARTHSQRNVITRALGAKPEVQVDPPQRLEWRAGDIVVLCSDGLSGLVQDGEIGGAVLKYEPQEAANQLVALANKRGGTDNISVIVLSGAKPGAAAAARQGAPAVKRAGSKWLLPMIGAVAALAVIAAVWFFMPGDKGKTEPTPAPLATTAVAVVSPPVIVETVVTNAPTAPVPPGTVVEVPTEQVAGPVSTARPTWTRMPARQSVVAVEVTVEPDATAIPTPIPQVKYPAPALLTPNENENIGSDRFTFQWSSVTPNVAENEHFDVRIWQKTTDKCGVGDEPHYGVTWHDDLVFDLDLAGAVGSRGQYCWAIALIRGQNGQWEADLSPESEARSFTYSPPGRVERREDGGAPAPATNTPKSSR